MKYLITSILFVGAVLLLLVFNRPSTKKVSVPDKNEVLPQTNINDTLTPSIVKGKKPQVSTNAQPRPYTREWLSKAMEPYQWKDGKPPSVGLVYDSVRKRMDQQ